MRPLITVRCKRCHRVAAKYWEHETGGGWITPDDYVHGPKKYYDDEIAELLDSGGSSMIARRVCYCRPSPTLPNGAELARLLERARAKPHPAEDGAERWRRELWTPLTIHR
jgi:hypothetical protein